MYYSITHTPAGAAAKFAAQTPAERAKAMAQGHYTELGFETTVLSAAAKTGHDPVLVAREMLKKDRTFLNRAMEVGAAELDVVCGGSEFTSVFLSQASTPAAALRFEGVGGVKDDLRAACCRAGAMAVGSLMSQETANEYVAHMKSLRRLVEAEITSGHLDAAVGNGAVKQIESAALQDLSEQPHKFVATLQERAISELFEEARQRLRAQYARVERPDDTPTP